MKNDSYIHEPAPLDDVHLPYELRVEQLIYDEVRINMFIPDQKKIKLQYEQQQITEAGAVFPYWARLWSSAKALVLFLNENRAIISGNSVLELGAGLGLPSMFAAFFAREVYCTDHDPDAVSIAKKSIHLNEFSNVSIACIDWNDQDKIPETEIILASDICYDPKQIPSVGRLFDSHLTRGKTIVMSTPPRLSSRDFIISLQPWIKQQSQYKIQDKHDDVISVFVLGK